MLMSGSRSSRPPAPKVPGKPRAALDALLAGDAADPIRRALWLDALDLRLRPHLPPSLAAHAQLANVKGATLVFLVDSPVWRARLRLASPQLIEAARSVGIDASEVVIKTTTHPLHANALSSERLPLPMSQASREALQAALASLEFPDTPLPDKPGK
jgi:hypothetical protein